MIVDSSAIVAVALREPERYTFENMLGKASVRRMSAGTWVELAAVAIRGRVIALPWLDNLLEIFKIEIEPVTIEQARIGHQAYREFGIGSGHRARLNFGDCFAYALAKVLDEPLLFKGDDFKHTDIRCAI